MTSATLAYVSVRQIFQITSGLAFDFTLRIGTPQLELGSTATAVNATSGTAYYGPRFDYDPVTKTPRGLLIEEARTNSIRNNTMQGAVAGTPGTAPTNWVIALNGITGVTLSVVGTGVQNGVTYIDVRANGTPSATISQGVQISFEPSTTVAASASQVWTQSVWVSVAAGSTANISGFVYNIQQYNAGAFVQSNNVAFTPSSSLTQYSGTVTFSAATTTAALPLIGIGVTAGQAIDITLRIGLPQLELGAFATSVIPTFGSTATRNADTASITTLTPWFNASAGTLYAEYSRFALSSAATSAGFDDTTTNNFMRFVSGAGVPANQRFDILTGGVSQATLLLNAAGVAGTIYKDAAAYKTNDVAASENGGSPLTSATTTLPSVTRMTLGTNSNGLFLNGYIRSIRYYPTRLPNATLQGLTV
jgi:hypothetical protein